ncbi:hypothetical protein ABIE61_002092 [Marinobacterium sp. MBR-111]|jgi:hypothetical protein|uniref:hypothetical protein n=1 Tax=Marinobacterium sp. MBR-111 TaxID=3156463 RepID=UPI003393C926
MPNRSTRASISSGLLLVLGCLQPAAAERQPLPYDVTRVDRYSGGQVHGRDAYEGMARGDYDRESMREVAFTNRETSLPPVQLVYPSDPPPVQEVVVAPQVEVVLRGEDLVFDQIRLDAAIQRCVFERVCTDEVKAIPGVYLGDDHSGDSEWSGRDDELEVITEAESGSEEPGLEVLGPGRTFIEVPAQSEPEPQPEPDVELIQLPDPG